MAAALFTRSGGDAHARDRGVVVGGYRHDRQLAKGHTRDI